MSKNVGKAAITILLAIGLTACGSGGEKADKKAVNGGANTEKETPVAAEEVLDASLVEANEPGENGKYVLKLKNTGSQEAVLEHGSSQLYDYTIKDSTGNVVYTYSADKMFTQAIVEKKVKPSESLEVEVDTAEGFKGLDKGQYTLEVWPVAIGTAELKTVKTVDWPGESKAVSNETVTADVTYVGLMDNHTIEVTDKNGEAIALQIDDTILKQLKKAEADQPMTVHYTDDGVSKKAVKVELK
ncbi:BsuPI-related putative proteinase inhibitor [Bacillus sp. FJAT-27445]|uniref:BsuPI-related putative proteinase inhibitor n=1 Tax=Bacillus sp. FJAT-27445 TaxID=1679166 RepID=UPI0007435131|nr:BsuPI-related putative proteinase inhibitor [Bacillus sp. FJAT-27445]